MRSFLTESPLRRTCLFLVTLLVAWSPLRGQSGTPSQAPQRQVGAQEPPRTAQASRVDRAPRLDGTIDDPLWSQATPISNFLQREPYEGQSPTERTEVRIVYDKHEVYFGITCSDSAPKGIVATELRRDVSQELDDYFEIIIDSSHDRRNAYVFQVNPLGTQRDALITEEQAADFLRKLPGSSPAWTRLLPSCWFLGLCQALRGRADPALSALAHLALPGLGAVIVIAFGVYAAGYHRHFIRIAEMTEGSSTGYSATRAQLGAWLDRWVLRTPFQKGCFRFVWKTLFRSESHRLVLAGVGGLGLVLASQALLSAFENRETSEKVMVSADGLSIPLILAFFIIVGLRIVFDIPVELRCNWLFRLMLDAEKHECEPLARRVILVSVLPWVLVISFPIYAFLGGWVVGCLHTIVVVTWSLLLTDAVLIRFRKLPFTCSFPLFQQHSILTLLGCVFGFLLFAVMTPQFESWALPDPGRMAGIVPVVAVVWYVLFRIRSNAIEIERTLIFEEAPTRTIEVLQLGD